ncbi:MAG: hypothetical protein WBM44_29600 [Waterburya sp.]
MIRLPYRFDSQAFHPDPELVFPLSLQNNYGAGLPSLKVKRSSDR